MRDYKIDSLRGIAILSVVLHHIFQFSNPLVTDSTSFEKFFIQNGQYGVELFFIISGFVMITYFSAVNNFFKFFVFRYTRLIPMLGIAILMIFILSFFEGNLSRQLIINGLFSFTLIDPQIIGKFAGSAEATWIDGSFWTLFVEIKFYLLYGAIFYITRKKPLKFRLSLLIAVLVSAKILNIVATYFGYQIAVKVTTHLFFTQYSGYFVSGLLISIGLNKKVFRKKLFTIFSSVAVIIFWSITSYYDSFQTRRTPIIFPIILTICFLIIYIAPKGFIEFFAKVLGSPSYVAYVFHLGIFSFLHREFPVAYSNTFYLGTSIVLFFGLSYIIHNLVELQFIEWLRHFIISVAKISQ